MHRFDPRWMLVAAALLAACAERQLDAPEAMASARAGAIESQLYSVELVMDHQAAIGLDDAQHAAIRAELQATQRELVDLELTLRGHREALAQGLDRDPVDEDAVMQAAAQVADDERAIKLAHLRLLVRIKHALTAEQQRALDGLR